MTEFQEIEKRYKMMDIKDYKYILNVRNFDQLETEKEMIQNQIRTCSPDKETFWSNFLQLVNNEIESKRGAQ